MIADGCRRSQKKRFDCSAFAGFRPTRFDVPPGFHSRCVLVQCKSCLSWGHRFLHLFAQSLHCGSQCALPQRSVSTHGYCTKHVDKNEFTSSPREESTISDTMILADTSFARFPRKPTIRHKRPLTSRSCRSGFATRWQSWSSLFGSVFLCRIDVFPGSYHCPNIAQILPKYCL